MDKLKDKRRGRGKFIECQNLGEMKKREREGNWCEFLWLKDREEEGQVEQKF